MSKILIVEDNEMNRDMLSRRLMRKGFEIVMAEDGQKGVDMSKSENPDLILMDLRMPIMDGFEAIKQLRADGIETPVIAVSAEINPQIERRARAAGANGVAAKPLEAEALRQLAFKWVTPHSKAGAA